MTNEQLLDSVGAVTKIALESGVASADIFKLVQTLTRTYERNQHSDTVKRVIDYVDSNYKKKITLDCLAKIAFVSRAHLSNIFSREMNTTLAEFMNRVRIDKSKPVLISTGNIEQAAKFCGINDKAYYSRVFRKLEGITPTQWLANN